jgi:hypothetical protein
MNKAKSEINVVYVIVNANGMDAFESSVICSCGNSN